MATPANWEEDDEWELINDDGFVYKRKKGRPAVDPTTTSASPSAPPLPDPAVEEKNRRERKRRALLKLKEKYQQEIHQWEHLSNTLNDMLHKSSIVPQQKSRELNDATTSSDQVSISPVPQARSSDPDGRRQLVDELLTQAEAQEIIIRDVSNLCDIAEALCSTREDKFKKSFTELPVWASSPGDVITSLCED